MPILFSLLLLPSLCQRGNAYLVRSGTRDTVGMYWVPGPGNEPRPKCAAWHKQLTGKSSGSNVKTKLTHVSNRLGEAFFVPKALVPKHLAPKRSNLPAGEKCNKNVECTSGKCAGNLGGLKAGTCQDVVKQQVGAECKKNSECLTNICMGNSNGLTTGKCSEQRLVAGAIQDKAVRWVASKLPLYLHDAGGNYKLHAD